MKITPAKDYRKPLYAIGLTATIMAVAVTGCTNTAQGKKSSHGDSDKTRTRETEYCKKDADYVIYEGEAVMAGEIDVEVTETIETDGYDSSLELGGATSIRTDPTETTSDENDVVLDGGVAIIDTDETT